MARDIDTSTEACERLVQAVTGSAVAHNYPLAATLRALAAQNAKLREALIDVLQRASRPLGGWLEGERVEAIDRIRKIAGTALAGDTDDH